MSEKKQTKEGECPSCKSTNIEYGMMIPEDDSVYYEVYCNKCDSDIREYYKLTYSESIID